MSAHLDFSKLAMPSEQSWVDIQRFFLDRSWSKVELLETIETVEERISKWPDELRTTVARPMNAEMDDWWISGLQENAEWVCLTRALYYDTQALELAKSSSVWKTQAFAKIKILYPCFCSSIKALETAFENFNGFQTLGLNSTMLNSDRTCSPRELSSILDIPALRQIKVLDLHETKTNHQVVERLIDSPSALELEILDLSWSNLSNAGVIALSNWRDSTLCSLNLAAAGISSHGLTTFLSAPLAYNLKSVDLSLNVFGQDGFKTLASSPNTFSLESLMLEGISPTSEGIELLFNSVAFPFLQQLSLAHNGLWEDSFESILHSSLFSQLSSLNLRGNSLTNRSLEQLCKMPFLENLEELDIGENEISVERAIPLIRNSSAFSPRLQRSLLQSLGASQST